MGFIAKVGMFLDLTLVHNAILVASLARVQAVINARLVQMELNLLLVIVFWNKIWMFCQPLLHVIQMQQIVHLFLQSMI